MGGMNLIPGNIRWLRIFKPICLLLFGLFVTAGEASDYQYLVPVGTSTGKGSEGVYAYRFDPVNGESSALVLAGSTVDVFTYHPTKGTLRRKQTISTLPKNFAGKNTAAEIAVDEKGTLLYVSNRGDGSIVVFSINPDDGGLTPLQSVPSGGKTPRHFAVDPTGKWLFAANQDSSNIALFGIDPKSGRLTTTPRFLSVASPVCLHFVAVK